MYIEDLPEFMRAPSWEARARVAINAVRGRRIQIPGCYHGPERVGRVTKATIEQIYVVFDSGARKKIARVDFPHIKIVE